MQSAFALYKGATPPAVGWAAIDSVLLGSLHNYRLFLIRHNMTEPVLGSDQRRLTLLGHGVAGLFAGLTRYSHSISATRIRVENIAKQRFPCHPNGDAERYALSQSRSSFA